MFPQHYKTFFILYNITYISIGVIMVAFGAAAIAAFLSLRTFVSLLFLAAPAIFVAVGIVKILLSVFGGVLTFFHKKPMIATYVILSVVLMLATYSAAIISFQERRRAYNQVATNLNSTYNTFNNNMGAINDIQNQFDCCGPTRDFLSVNGCSSNRPNNTVFGRGCLQPVSDVVVERLYDLGAMAMAFGSFELTAFLVAIQHTEGSGL